MAGNGNMTRFGISADQRLLEDFDSLIRKEGYVNRSEAIRDMIRNQLVKRNWENDNKETIGTINLVYKHGLRKLTEKIAELQHHNHTHIISSLHVHLDNDRCFEVLVVKGTSLQIREVADKLIGIKGVIHGNLSMSTTGKDLY
ncbi:MAG: nickel-responsive transcriptional regulator NikR [Nitrospiraceae bacterium]|nr:MAG: nickel-responsive transcriptional regulator NikR [Nitrospiraceae bacterium]